MTTHRTARCQHCQIPYTYQGSGYGCMEAHNSATHCPTCQAAISAALSSITVRRVRVWAETKEVDLKELLREEARDTSPIRRASFPLFDLEKNTSDRSGFVRHNRRLYEYRFWPGQEDKAVIRVEMEEDVGTKERWPWGEGPSLP